METEIRLAGIDLNLLLILSLLLQTRSVTGTARKLGMSQPAVSRSLAQLREAFHDPLLIRTNKGMELSRRAEDLIEPLQLWLTDTSALFRAKSFTPETLDRKFRIASTDFGVLAVVAPALPHIHDIAPGAGIEVCAFSDNMVAKLGTGDLDLIITGIEPDLSATYGQNLFTESSRCIVRADHPALLENSERLSLDSYLKWPHISTLVGENAANPINVFLGERASERQIVAALPYFHVAPELLSVSDAIMTVPSRLAKTFANDPDVVVIAPPEEIGTFDYWLLWHERSRRDPAILWIVEMLAATCTNPVA